MKIKDCIILISLIFFSIHAKAQKDTTIYYLTNHGKIVNTKDSADVLVYILPPDIGKNDKIYIVKAYYADGTINLIGGSLTNRLPLKLQGSYTAYAPSGKITITRNFENGEASGDVVQYYPNGRFYCKKSIVKASTDFVKEQLKDCNDSTGKALTKNGNGTWVVFDSNFKKVVEEGKVIDGLRDSIWKIRETDTTGFLKTYKAGKVVTSQRSIIEGDKFYAYAESAPEFPGGPNELGKFLNRNVHYPSIAKKNGTQGIVMISFIIEKDGKLTDIKVARGLGNGCDEEALRVIKLFPPWKPGVQNGKAVRVAYTVPVSFKFEN